MHPFELEMGSRRRSWPEIDLTADPDRLFESLQEPSISRFVMEGLAPHRPGSIDRTRHRFRFSQRTYREHFSRLVSRIEHRTERAILDAYFSAFWTAWRDGPADMRQVQYFGGFRPGIIADDEAMQKFVAAYPKGRVISVIRDPVTWWVSARSHKPEFRDRDAAARHWNRSTRAALDWHANRPDESRLVVFEELLLETERTMRSIAAWLDIRWEECLLEPTLAGAPMRADSSFPEGTYGVRTSPVQRASLLSQADKDHMLSQCGDLHDEALDRIRGQK
jgi:hypothetical protein